MRIALRDKQERDDRKLTDEANRLETGLREQEDGWVRWTQMLGKGEWCVLNHLTDVSKSSTSDYLKWEPSGVTGNKHWEL